MNEYETQEFWRPEPIVLIRSIHTNRIIHKLKHGTIYKIITMSDRKQSGYQKLKQENESLCKTIVELEKDIEHLVTGSEEQKAAVIQKYSAHQEA